MGGGEEGTGTGTGPVPGRTGSASATATASGSGSGPEKKKNVSPLRNVIFVFLQKWRAMVEVRFLRSCVDPNAPQEPLDADAQAEVDGGEGGGEVPLDEEDDDGSVAGSLPSGSPSKGSPPPSQASQPGSGGSQGAE